MSERPVSERLVAAERLEDDEAERSIRPLSLDYFVGQRKVRENLRIFIQAASRRGEALDHVLLFGPPGLGKTTLAQIVAREMGVGFKATSGPVIQRAGDLAALLTNLSAHDVLFIDEIHRLMPAVEEVLYPAMEDFQLDLIIGEGPAARSIKLDLPPFTLVGATTRSGLITRPLRERFGIRSIWCSIHRRNCNKSSSAGLASSVSISPGTAPRKLRDARAERRASPDVYCAVSVTLRPWRAPYAWMRIQRMRR